MVPLAFHATTGELAVATSAAYTLAMLLLTLRLFLPASRRTLARGAAARIEGTLAATLRSRLDKRGGLPASWRGLGDEAFLLQLDAAASGEPVAIGPAAGGGPEPAASEE